MFKVPVLAVSLLPRLTPNTRSSPSGVRTLRFEVPKFTAENELHTNAASSRKPSTQPASTMARASLG